MINKFIISGLLFLTCCTPTNIADTKPVPNTNTTATASATVVAPIAKPPPPPTPPAEKENKKDIEVPDDWSNVSGFSWSAYAPIKLENPDNTEFSSMYVLRVDKENMLFVVDVAKNTHDDLKNISEDMENILTDTGLVSVNNNKMLNINGNDCFVLETSSNGSTLKVDVYLFLINGNSYAVSCGSKNFTTEYKGVCRSIVNTFKFE